MKAAVFYGPKDIRFEEVDTPAPKEGEVLIKVKACAICGTDKRIYDYGHRAVKPPHIIGHEISGSVESMGNGVKGLAKGDKVTITTEVSCGHCRFCLEGRPNLCNVDRRAIGYYYPGGFAEYILIPSEAVQQGNIIKVGKSADLDEISIVEPLACVINSHELIDIKPGDSVLIMGSGPIGCMHIELAKLRGASKVAISGKRPKIDLARRFEADYYIVLDEDDVKEKVDEITGSQGVDVVIVACSSVEAQRSALELAGTRGRVCYFGGLPKGKFLDGLDTNLIHYKELKVMGSFSSNRSHTLTAINLIENQRISVSKYITHKFALKDIVKGLEAAISGEAIKAVINP
jgi:L-iditol 2-dehydrogenase